MMIRVYAFIDSYFCTCQCHMSHRHVSGNSNSTFIKFHYLCQCHMSHRHRHVLSLYLLNLIMCLCYCHSLVFIFLARLMMFSVGSEPIDRKQISGTLFSDSSASPSILKITALANCKHNGIYIARHKQETRWRLQEGEKNGRNIELDAQRMTTNMQRNTKHSRVIQNDSLVDPWSRRCIS